MAACETWGKKCQITGAPPPVVSRKPHAGLDRDPQGCKVKGFWAAIACPGGVAHRTGTCTDAALPTALSAGASSEPRHSGDRDHSAPGGYVPALPELPGAPAPRGRTHLRREGGRLGDVERRHPPPSRDAG